MLADDSKVTALRERLSAHLRTAMKARDAARSDALRALLARLDQATAVPLTNEHAPVFGRSGEVPRRSMTWTEAQALVQDEINEKRRAIATYKDLKVAAEVERLEHQLDFMRRYRED